MTAADPTVFKDPPEVMKKSGSECSLNSCNDRMEDPAVFPAQLNASEVEEKSAAAAATRAPRKKGIAWTEEEHRQFLLGLQKLGRGDWRGISWHYVRTRTPTQVASHAQKYFIRQENSSKRKKRSSLFDLTIKPTDDEGENSGDSTRETAPETGSCTTSVLRASEPSQAPNNMPIGPHQTFHGYHPFSFPIQDQLGMQLAAQLQALRSLATASSVSTAPTPTLPVAPLNAMPFGFTVPMDASSTQAFHMPLFYNQPAPQHMLVPVSTMAPSAAMPGYMQAQQLPQKIYRPVASFPKVKKAKMTAK